MSPQQYLLHSHGNTGAGSNCNGDFRADSHARSYRYGHTHGHNDADSNSVGVGTGCSDSNDRPVPTATPNPTSAFGPDPALARYSPLLVEALSTYLADYEFIRDGLSERERLILDWADSRIFSNPAFLASKWGPDQWPGNVRTRSAAALVELMRTIEVQKRADGKHAISWPLDGLDRVLDDFGVYEGKCVTCYEKDDYGPEREVIKNYVTIVTDPGHVHREMLKHFAYFAKADGEGILIRSFMENDSDDFEMLYDNDPIIERDLGNFSTTTLFGIGYNSFMSQHKLREGTYQTFPAVVYGIAGGAGSEREAAELWFDHLNVTMSHYTGDKHDFAENYYAHSQTRYTPKPGELMERREAGSRASASLTASTLRLPGLKSEQFFSPQKGRRTGVVEIEGHRYYHNGNASLSPAELPMCVFFASLEQVDNHDYRPDCRLKLAVRTEGAITVSGSAGGLCALVE
ncbi:MAG: hypothetical protein OXI91_10200 [Chloroflexota bacterium]|nr:hypothetical protein [Chloroflexota bacterium]